MINRKEHYLRKICAEYEQVENYAEAVADKTQSWIMHHRNGIKISTKELKRLGLYFKRPAGEFIFLTKAEHNRLHNTYARHETRKKLSEWQKGKKLSEDHKKKMSDSMKGLKCWNNGIINVRAKECPDGFVPGMLKK